MTDFLGMDLIRAEAFCDLLDERTRTAQQSVDTVQACFGDLPWFGEDGDAFRDAWVALLKRIMTAIDALIAKARALREQIEQQRAASTVRMGGVSSMIAGAHRATAGASPQ